MNEPAESRLWTGRGNDLAARNRARGSVAAFARAAGPAAYRPRSAVRWTMMPCLPLMALAMVASGSRTGWAPIDGVLDAVPDLHAWRPEIMPATALAGCYVAILLGTLVAWVNRRALARGFAAADATLVSSVYRTNGSSLLAGALLLVFGRPDAATRPGAAVILLVGATMAAASVVADAERLVARAQHGRGRDWITVLGDTVVLAFVTAVILS